MKLFVTLAVAVSVLAFFSFSEAASENIPQGALCEECGMSVDSGSNYSAYIVTVEDETYYFCDIGDMLYHLKKKKSEAKSIHVRDNSNGGWIDGKTAWYVKDDTLKTPMGWSIAAYQQKPEGAVGLKKAQGLLK